MHEMRLRYNPNIQNAMKWHASKCVHTGTQTEAMINAMRMRYLEVRAHGHANRGNGKMIWNGKWAYTNMSEPQPHSHRMPADKKKVPRIACTRARKPRQWHTQCNMAKMAYKMQHWLIQTWESLSHTHIRVRWMKMKCLEMRAHGHANRGNVIRNAIWLKWHIECNMDLY